MFVVEKDGKFAVNIEKTERILISLPCIKTYTVETEEYKLAEYETPEAAKYAFKQLIAAIATGDKVFFMPTEEEAENADRS